MDTQTDNCLGAELQDMAMSFTTGLIALTPENRKQVRNHLVTFNETHKNDVLALAIDRVHYDGYSLFDMVKNQEGEFVSDDYQILVGSDKSQQLSMAGIVDTLIEFAYKQGTIAKHVDKVMDGYKNSGRQLENRREVYGAIARMITHSKNRHVVSVREENDSFQSRYDKATEKKRTPLGLRSALGEDADEQYQRAIDLDQLHNLSLMGPSVYHEVLGLEWDAKVVPTPHHDNIGMQMRTFLRGCGNTLVSSAIMGKATLEKTVHEAQDYDGTDSRIVHAVGFNQENQLEYAKDFDRVIQEYFSLD